MSLEKVRTIFRSAFSKHRLATNIITSGGLLMLGDVIQQHVELYKGLHTKGAAEQYLVFILILVFRIF